MPTPSNPDWQALPVWRCPEDICGKQWAACEEQVCPFCHVGKAVSTGFTCGELHDVQEKYGFDDFPVHIPVPVPEVVQLSTLPQATWIGLPVFHPMSQEGDKPNWVLYDVGIVIDVFPDPDFHDLLCCRFVHAVGESATLRYGPDNLWVPKSLADRLL